MTKLSRKKIRFGLKLASSGGGSGRDSIVPVIRDLTTVLRKRLRRLSSERISPLSKLLGARKLELIMIRSKFDRKRNRFRQVGKRILIQRTWTDATASVSFKHLHMLKRKEMEFMVIQACLKIDNNIQKTTSSLALQASRFCKIDGLRERTERAFRKMDEFNIPFDPYKPLTEEQARILHDLPIFRKPEHVPELMVPVQPLDPNRLRQTKISDYFNAISKPQKSGKSDE